MTARRTTGNTAAAVETLRFMSCRQPKEISAYINPRTVFISPPALLMWLCSQMVTMQGWTALQRTGEAGSVFSPPDLFWLVGLVDNRRQ